MIKKRGKFLQRGKRLKFLDKNNFSLTIIRNYHATFRNSPFNY